MNKFINLLKKELVQNIGFGILAFVFVFFARFVTYMALLNNAIEQLKYNPMYGLRPGEVVLEYIGSNNPFHGGVVIVLAGLFALLFCRYLHVRKTVDFYHSLPFKKTTVFAAKYLTGIIYFVVGYALNGVLMIILTGAWGYLSGAAVSLCIKGIFNGIFGFTLIYSVSFLAGLLTASVLTHITLASIFMFIVPLLIAIKEYWFERFFTTFYSTLDYDFVAKTSPLSYFVMTLNDKGIGSICAMLIASLVFTAICFILCRYRPSEATETALAFRKTISPLRIFFSLTTGICGGFVIAEMFNSEGHISFIIGTFVILIISSVIIEIIFRFDFTQALNNKRCIVIAAAIAATMLVATFAFRESYNTYVPAENKIASASISITDFACGEEYKKPLDENDYNYNLYYNSDYMTYRWTNYQSIMDNMKVTDKSLINRFAAACAKSYTEIKDIKEKDGSDQNIPLTIALSYKIALTSGREVCRNYTLIYDENKELIAELFENKEFKNALWYNNYRLDSDNIAELYVINLSELLPSDRLIPTEEQEARLREAVKTDLDNMTFEEFITERPIAHVNFMNRKTEDPYSDKCIFAVLNLYPSYKNTISVMEEMGYKVYTDEEIKNKITKISIDTYGKVDKYSSDEEVINSYKYSSDGEIINLNVPIVYTSAEEIAAIYPHIEVRDYSDTNQRLRFSGEKEYEDKRYYGGYVYIGDKSFQVDFKNTDYFPDFVKADLEEAINK